MTPPANGSASHDSLFEVTHRPWPLPAAPWTWRQSWHDLLFMHWPVPAYVLHPLVPEPLVVEEREGTAWLAMVPFRMSGVMRRPWPDLPWVSAFPELNVRTYVSLQGKPGVWFLSLDAANWLAVWAARRFFHLPYFLADMSLVEGAQGIRYRSTRPDAAVDLTYRAVSEPYLAAPGSLEHWLTERYCLYAKAPDGTMWRNEVHHRPWPLQRAEATVHHDTLLQTLGFVVDGPPLLHFARRLDVVVWNAERVI